MEDSLLWMPNLSWTETLPLDLPSMEDSRASTGVWSTMFILSLLRDWPSMEDSRVSCCAMSDLSQIAGRIAKWSSHQRYDPSQLRRV